MTLNDILTGCVVDYFITDRVVILCPCPSQTALMRTTGYDTSSPIKVRSVGWLLTSCSFAECAQAGSLEGFVAKRASAERAGKLDGDGRAFVERMVRGVEEGRLGELNRKLDDAEAALASERARTQALEAALRSAGLAVPMQVDV